MAPIFLKLVNVSKYYESTDGVPPVRVLDRIDLEVRAGESLAILGPSGSGKSTLLNIIGTLDTASAGEVLIEGQDLTTMTEAQLVEVRSRRIGFIFQAHHLLPQCTALENVLIPTLASDDSNARRAALERAKRLLDRVGLSGRLNHFPGQLSGGERQRVAVVRALINEPRLILADEPTGALDRAAANELSHLLLELNREQNTALIVVTHSLELSRLMGRQFMLSDGQLRAFAG